jgi:hypothetical protein
MDITVKLRKLSIIIPMAIHSFNVAVVRGKEREGDFEK